MNIKNKHKKFSQILCFLFIFMLLFQCLMPSETVYAKISGHDTYVIQPRLQSNGIYTTNSAVKSQVTFGKGLEEGSGYNFGTLFESGNYDSIGMGATATISDDFGDYLYFSFPSHDSTEWLDNDYDNTSGDFERASKVAELIEQLNSLIETVDSVDGNKNITNAAVTITATKELSNGVVNPNALDSIPNDHVVTVNLGNSVGTLFYCYYTGSDSDKIYYEESLDGDVKLKAYFTTKSGATFNTADVDSYQSFYWAQLKGYLTPTGKLADRTDSDGDGKRDVFSGSDHDGSPYLSTLSKTEISPMGDKLNSDSGDNAWITIFDMATVANFYYAAEGITVNDEAEQMNWFEEMIVGIVQSFVMGIKSLLGLTDITELIYNNDTNSLSGGTMNNSWWSVMLKYHLIFQIIAWLLVGLAVAKMLLELNFSTINPQVRISIFETLQKIFIVGFLLALAVPIIRLMTDVNASLVGIFKTQAPVSDGDMFNIGGTLASIIAYLSYVGILLMLNCTYIMRGIMIAIFGASAPLFIVSMLFSKGKGMFDNWLKEMAANIFLQSIHAFAFAFLFSVIKTSSFLPKLVVFWSLMPITEQFRGFIFGSSGGFTTKQGNAMGSFIQKQATAQTRSTASTTSNIAGKGLQNSNFGKKLGLKGAEETGNASGVGGGQGRGQGQGAGGNGLENVTKDAAKQMRANGAGKSATVMAAAGHALSAGGQIGGQVMDMMDAMTDIQNGDFNSASRSIENVRASMGNMATSLADYGTEGISNMRDRAAQKTLQKAGNNSQKSLSQSNKTDKQTGKNMLSYANAYASGNTKVMDNIASNGTGMSKANIKEAKKIGKAMKRMGVSSINKADGTLSYGAPSGFQGKDGNEHSVVDSSAMSGGKAIDANAVFGSNADIVKAAMMTDDYAVRDSKGNITGYSLAGVNLDTKGNVTNAQALSTGVSNNGKQTYFNTTRMTQNVMSSHENQQQRIRANNYGAQQNNIANNSSNNNSNYNPNNNSNNNSTNG